MRGVHDLGGRLGFGPVAVGDDAIFHADWERRAFALTQLAQRAAGFNTDAFRHGIEREDPATYLGASYFDKWIRNAERMLVEGGVLGSDAIAAHIAGSHGHHRAQRTTNALPPNSRGAKRKVAAPPRFGVGDRVRVRSDLRAIGHTRLPDYVAANAGTVVLVNGGWVFPDAHAHGQGECPAWVYAVRFSSRDLWPGDPGPSHSIHVDLFEPYLLVI